MLPVYAHFVVPSEYGIYSLAQMVGTALALLMSFGMVMTVGRFYFAAGDESEREAFLGAIFVFLLIAPLGVALGLEWFGEKIFLLLTPDIPYDPYIRLVVWTTYLANFSTVPLMVLRSREEAIHYTAISVAKPLLFHALGVLLVIRFSQGALGLLRANLFVTVLFVPVYMMLARDMLSLSFSLNQIKQILLYSLPLVPHNAAGWVLRLSDRYLMQAWVPLAGIGVYSMGYQLGSASEYVAHATNAAWFPSFFRSARSETHEPGASRTATYIVAAVSGVSLVVIVTSYHLVTWFLPLSYAGAKTVAFWVSLSGMLVMLYNIWSLAIHQSKRTIYLPLISWLAGMINVAINVLLIPRHGYVIAAVSTAFTYLVMALASAVVAYGMLPFSYEYRRWLKAIVATIGLATMSELRPTLEPAWDLLYSMSLLIGWPVLLGFLNFYTVEEMQSANHFLGRTLKRVRVQ